MSNPGPNLNPDANTGTPSLLPAVALPTDLVKPDVGTPTPPAALPAAEPVPKPAVPARKRRPDAMQELLARYNCGPVKFSGTRDGLYERHLTFDNVVPVSDATARERFEAAARSVRDVLSQRWLLTERTYAELNPKRVYYLSMEFLIGRALANNVVNLGLQPLLGTPAGRARFNPQELIAQEPDAGLGNGGLGRLAACFLESLATLQIPAMGYGLRYEYGIFRQHLQQGWQREQPDHWLARPDPWEVPRPDETVEVNLNCSFEPLGGDLKIVLDRPLTLVGVPFDRPVVGYGGNTIGTLRLWAATTTNYFHFDRFSHGDFAGALAESLTAETITRVLYPDDSTTQGQGLRFLQEYFLVACSVGDMVRRFRRNNSDWHALPDKAAAQLNDTHPAMAVAELMRVLLDDAHLGWDEAWEITRRALAYTNHTLLPEALERWPVRWFELMVPRVAEIIYEINRRLLDDVRAKYPDDLGRVVRMSLVEEGAIKKVRMANLAIVGTHSTNGVAQIHSDLLRKRVVPDFADMYPERFNNKTNGVTPRRWLLVSNPHLSALITRAIGDGWVTDLQQLEKLRSLATDAEFQSGFKVAKRHAKERFAVWVKSTVGAIVDPDTIFDCQVKRIHEYKRQLLNALHIVVLYNRLREHPDLVVPPRTFLFAGKAAPAYFQAKLVVKFINNLARTISADPEMNGKLKVLFLPDYCVSMAERLIPAADVSEQISTAGYEASGTSNMKFMMNGALTIGTRDGATIEMAEAAGEENFFLFGLTAEQVAGSRGWYSPQWHYDHEPETRAALDLIFSNHFCPDEPGIFAPLRDILLTGGDHYMHLADLKSYTDTQSALGDVYLNPTEWRRRAILNVAASGRFSSDRTIAEYARDIWHAAPCKIV